MKKALLTISISVTASSLAFALAQTTITIGSTAAQQGQINGTALVNLLALAQTLVSNLGVFAIGLAVLAFFWFLITFIWKGKDSPEKQSESLKGMGYSILALFVMVSIWGIIGLLGSIVGVNQGGNIPIPGIPRPTA